MKIKKVTFEEATGYANQIGKGMTLYQAYNRPSYYKERAYQRCLELAQSYNAIASGITGYNTTQFTFGFYCEDENGVVHIYKITKDNDYELIVK